MPQRCHQLYTTDESRANPHLAWGQRESKKAVRLLAPPNQAPPAITWHQVEEEVEMARVLEACVLPNAEGVCREVLADVLLVEDVLRAEVKRS